MYKFAFFLIQLLILIFVLTIIFSNPFVISLDIGNFKYSFSSNFLSIIIITLILALYIFIYIIFKSRLSLSKYLLNNKYKKLEKGYFYFVEAMISITNKDNRNAIKFHKKMNSYLKDDPTLSLLLKSEVYKIENKYEQLLEVYENMLKSKKTQRLGYRGLMEQNLKNHDYHHAFLYGEKLFNLSPEIEKLYETLTYITAKTKNWNHLILITNKAYSKKIINKETLNENNSIAYFEIAKIKSNSDIDGAIKNINKAINLKKNFPPYIKLHLELVAKSNDLHFLKKLIKKYWNSYASSLIRTIICQIIVDNKMGDINFVNQIIKNSLQNDESKKLLIFFAIKNQKWEVARKNISGLIGSNPTREICLFMADIELGENNDKQKSDSWILRSENSLSENTWICKVTNQSQEEWNSLSNSGYFNSLVLNNLKMIDINNK